MFKNIGLMHSRKRLEKFRVKTYKMYENKMRLKNDC